MLIKEYRIVMPVTVDEYRRGQLYSTSEASKNETGGGEGIEVLKNENFDNIPLLNGKFTGGQYTYKIYHLESKAPRFLRMITPKNALDLHEESWNAYPYCKTVLTNPHYMKENFTLIVESLHMPGVSNEDNVLELPEDVLKQREVIFIDITSPVDPVDYSPLEDPTTFISKKTKRGPLIHGSWMTDQKVPYMTCYKLVTINCKWFGLQKRIEKIIQKSEKRLFHIFHRQIFCWIDCWYELTLEDIRRIEDETKEILDHQRKSGSVRGLRAASDVTLDPESARSSANVRK